MIFILTTKKESPDYQCLSPFKRPWHDLSWSNSPEKETPNAPNPAKRGRRALSPPRCCRFLRKASKVSNFGSASGENPTAEHGWTHLAASNQHLLNRCFWAGEVFGVTSEKHPFLEFPGKDSPKNTPRTRPAFLLSATACAEVAVWIGKAPLRRKMHQKASRRVGLGLLITINMVYIGKWYRYWLYMLITLKGEKWGLTWNIEDEGWVSWLCLQASRNFVRHPALEKLKASLKGLLGRPETRNHLKRSKD